MAEETAAVDSQAVCVLDDLTDDYDRWDGELPEMQRKDEAALYVPSLVVSNSDLTLHPESAEPKPPPVPMVAKWRY